MTTSDESVATMQDQDLTGDLLATRKVKYSAKIVESGPCRKKIDVSIPEEEIATQMTESVGDFRKEAQVPGFRPGRVPKVLLERRFKKEVADRVKSGLLLSVLEQVEKDHKLNLISQPKLDFESVALPESGPLTFEMEVEVRPDFDAPAFEGFTVKRPTRDLTDKDSDEHYRSFLERYADIVPKSEGGAEPGDILIADLKFSRGGETVNEAKDIQFRLQPELRFQDGRVPECGKALAGVKAGETRTAKALVGSASADESLRGQEIDVAFEVKDLKFLRLPKVDESFLYNIGFETEEELRDALKRVLHSRYESNRKMAVRKDLMDQLIAAVPFDLPKDLVGRQTRDTLRKRLMDLRESGLSDVQIRAREAELRANAYESTIRGLKEYFILDKIADKVGIKVEESDIEEEIARMAEREDMSPRRVRARLEKENSMDFLAIQVLENKTIDHILSTIKIEDVVMEDEKEVETVNEAATPGGLADPDQEAASDSSETAS
jgi:trigger factor